MDPDTQRGRDQSTAGESHLVQFEQDVAGHVDSLREAPLCHIRVGRYQLKREIGSGGMGVVYEAIQDQPRRSVALKLMRAGTQSRSNLRRFEYESQLLARLRHPGIAQVFDAGAHQQGTLNVPYYVMEYIPGARSITEYAKQKKLDVRQRLELFAQVCDAVHHAHQKGIIHRDIKPQNILIDTLGQPKVIDFGVARAADSDLASLTVQTEASQLLGTLQYMSPEQLESDSSELDARSDVYSLGVVLYELLCNRFPYDVSRRDLSSALRIIRETAPTSMRQVNPHLGPDVETVVLKAMSKARERRFATTADLANDVRHVLAGEPIEARRDSATYVLRKRAGALAARHRITTWLMVVILAAAVAKAAGAAMHQWPATRLLFHRTVTSRVQPNSGFAPMTHTRMISMHDATDWEALAREVGAANVSTTQPMGLRPLHGKLFERLVAARARVFVVDILFRQPKSPTTAPAQEPMECPHERELLHGIRQLQTVTPVVLTAGELWDVGTDYFPRSLCAGLAREARWGFITASLGADTPWSVDLIVTPRERHPMPSLALAACAAYWRADRYAWVTMTFDHPAGTPFAQVYYARPDQLQPRAWGAAWEEFTDRVRLTQALRAPADDPRVGRKVGDTIGYYVVHVPGDDVLRAATFDYANVMRATDEQLRAWFEGKVVVLGDARANRDGPHPLPDGRRHCGFVAHAVAINAILSAQAIVAPPRVRVLGMSIGGREAYDCFGAAVGGLVAVAITRSAWRRRFGAVVLIVALALLSVLVYRQSQVYYDPLVAMMGGLLACEGVAFVTRTRATRFD